MLYWDLSKFFTGVFGCDLICTGVLCSVSAWASISSDMCPAGGSYVVFWQKETCTPKGTGSPNMKCKTWSTKDIWFLRRFAKSFQNVLLKKILKIFYAALAVEKQILKGSFVVLFEAVFYEINHKSLVVEIAVHWLKINLAGPCYQKAQNVLHRLRKLITFGEIMSFIIRSRHANNDLVCENFLGWVQVPVNVSDSL